MHIPDGYLSPETCGVFGAGMVPVFATAGKRVRRVVKSRYVPLLALAAAFSFLVMMLNVPIPDGTTAHAVGAVLIAVILGPEAAIIAISTALAIQALFFGDGGVLAYGANTFNMAFVMPMVGYYLVYKPLTRKASLTSPRRAFAAALGGYIGLNASALVAAIEFGVQPELFTSASGAPLYAPYHLSQTIPTMMLAHLTVAGGVEFALTLGVVLYLQRANLPILRINHAGVSETDGDLVVPPSRRKWWYALGPIAAVALITPLGLIYNSGAFGEDPALAKPVWHHVLFSGYDFSHDKHPAVGYLISAFLGAGLIALVLFGLFGIARLIQRRRPAADTVGATLSTALAINGTALATDATNAAVAAADAATTTAAIAAADAATTTAATAAADAATNAGNAATTTAAAAAGTRTTTAGPAPTSRTPAWLVQAQVGMCPCGCIGKRTRGSFVQKTLSGGATLMRQAMFGEDIATGPGLLQRIDPRVKLVTMLSVLIGTALVRNIEVLLALYAVTLLLAVASHLKLSFFIKRVWLFIPVFTGVVVLPATLNIVTAGHIVIPLGHWWFGRRIGMTSEGLHSAALIVSRVAVSISIVVLLTLTTPWAKLMAALRAIRVPRMFIQIMGMAYRYIFYLLGSVDDMYTARKSRMVGADTEVKAGRAFVSATAGALFGKAHSLSEEVYMAMVSRGYTGDAVSIDTFEVRALEAVWVAACVVTIAATLGIDRAIGR
ncbi:MAG: cobalt/nickel transport system permease protein [Acidimicrobiaceae bacterium]|nr:cobalt/nickel transport system permease protein [Acidimicrobiaceae bacterium]